MWRANNRKAPILSGDNEQWQGRSAFGANAAFHLQVWHRLHYSIFLNKRIKSRGISKSSPSNTFLPVFPSAQLVKRQHWQRPQEIKWRPVCANVMPHGSMQCVRLSYPSLPLSLCFSLPLWACVRVCVCWHWSQGRWYTVGAMFVVFPDCHSPN